MLELPGPMLDEIAMDLDEALRSVETDAQGTKHWRDVVFAAVDGFRPLTLYLSVPKSSEPAPLVVFIHGGAWLAGHPMVTNPVYRGLDPFGKLLAAGFAVARISYRFTSEGSFPMQLHDCKSAVRFLRNRADRFGIDAGRIAAMGDSAGGHLALMLGLTAHVEELEGTVGDRDGSSAVQAVINWFGPTELLTMQNHAPVDGWQDHNEPDSPESRLVGGAIQLNKEKSTAASPLTFVTASAPPMLTQHGDRDRLVPIEQANVLHAALLKVGADSTLDTISGADHCFWGVDDPGIVERDIQFLREKL